MSYLRFDKTLMTNLEESLTREIFRNSRSGAYHCTTIVDCNTRKYHGLLVMPVPELDDENHVLLASLDETVVQHGAEFNLGLHKYQGDNYCPRGHKYIREFDSEHLPTTLYRVGGVVLKKEKAFVHEENRILIRYTLVEAHTPITLRLRPFLAFRSVRFFTHENPYASRDYQEIENGIKTCMYPGYPELHMQTNKKSAFRYQPDWYRNMEYPMEQERGYESKEDLYVPGYFELEMKKGESIVFSGGVSPVVTRNLKRQFEREAEVRKPRDTFRHCLRLAAHQFHLVEEGRRYIVAGQPWFKCRARDMFIALPGLTLSIKEEEEFHAAMATATVALRNFMAGEPISNKVTEVHHPDVLLWAVWSLQQYAKFTSMEECRKRYGKLLVEMIDYIRGGCHPNLFLHQNGLLYACGTHSAVTWMNSTLDGHPVVPRSGYIVEFNALWYNALCFVADLIAEENEALAQTYQAQAKLAGSSFVDTFLNVHGYLFDYVDGAVKDWSVRPNMVFTCAFDYSPLTPEQRKRIVDICTKELLTAKGLRSLSPKSGGYNPVYVGTPRERDRAYHNGTAWPWLAGFYFEAFLRVYKRSGISFIERQMIGFEEEMTSHCLATIPELYDGNPPFHGRGAISFAMNVGEILRILKLLKKLKQS